MLCAFKISSAGSVVREDLTAYLGYVKVAECSGSGPVSSQFIA